MPLLSSWTSSSTSHTKYVRKYAHSPPPPLLSSPVSDCCFSPSVVHRLNSLIVDTIIMYPSMANTNKQA